MLPHRRTLSTTKQIKKAFIVAFRQSLSKMTNFNINIVSDTVCRKLS